MKHRTPDRSRPSAISLAALAFVTRIYRTKIKPRLTKKNIRRAALVSIAILIIVPIGTYAYYARDIQDKDRLMNRNNTGIILKDRNGEAFYSSGLLSTKDDVPLAKISDHVEDAAIASEDKDFYNHRGFSLRGTARAFINNVTNRDATGSGGSTITQQLVKNKLLGSQKNYLRKYQEVAMALAVERRYTKEEILEMYLNSAYFGNGAFGISDAAHTYFGKEPAELTLAESSMLVGLLPAPSLYSPITGDADEGKGSQRNVLRKMVATGKITNSERDEALKTELTYSNDAKKGGADYAQHYADMIVKELEEKYGEERVKRAGFTVTTTLDLSKQKAAEQIIRDHIAKTTSRGGSNAGLVSIDPRSGQVLAMVGSVDYYNEEFGQVNMATALRQPGSSFKPIYYSDAIDRKLITAATVLDDTRTTFGNSYTPKNYDNRYKGKMTVRSALAESRNVPAVQVMQKETVQKAAEAAQRMGIDTVSNPERYGLSLALGTAEVKLIQMTSAYGAFANGGQRFNPVLYTKVVDKYGKTILNNESSKSEKVLSPEAAYITASILSDTRARAPTFGSSLNIAGKNVALKTGTTNDNRDAWTIGFTPSIVTGVWLGNNANQPMQGLAGGSSAGTIWKNVMTNYLKNVPRENFTRPSGVVAMQVCDDTASSGRIEYFKKGTQPEDTCTKKDAPADIKEKPDKDKKKPEEEKTKPNGSEKPKDTNSTGGDGTDTSEDGEEETDGTGTTGGDNTTTPPSSGGTTTPRPPTSP
ncbi:MAG TPA: transglycosylase domain-containing protein [Candidatus Saccharimonadales bacterium]